MINLPLKKTFFALRNFYQSSDGKAENRIEKSRQLLNLFIMKRTVILIASMLLCGLMLTNCGNKPPKNEIIGNLPAIASEYAKTKAENEAWAQSLTPPKNKEQAMKLIKEINEKEEAMEQKFKDKLDKELETIKGKELPVVNNNPNVEVTALKLHDGSEKHASFQGTMLTKTMREGTYVKCQFQDKDGNVIQETSAYIKHAYSGWGKHEVPEGSYETTISLEITDETAKLAKVVFIPEN